MPYERFPFDKRDSNEEWRDIPGFSYEVSDGGHVASKRTLRVLKGGLAKIGNAEGYLMVTLRRDNTNYPKMVHVLVAEAFLGSRPFPNAQVNHINPPTLDNRADNLEWASPSRNVQHAYDTGLIKTKSVRIVETGDIFNSASECARFLGVHRTVISNHLSGRLNSVRGYHIEKLD